MKKIIYSLLMCMGLSNIVSAQQNPSFTLLREKDNKSEYVWVASHRGDWIYAPENSTTALEHAIFFGSDLIETDVRLTKDGKIIMMHDATVDRTTNGKGNIADLTLAEIKELRLRNNFGGLPY